MAIEELEMEVPETHVSSTVDRLIETCSQGWERFFAAPDNDLAQGSFQVCRR